MTWFCGSRHKRRNKSRVSNVQYSRDENGTSRNGKQFAVVLQNFEASVSDELNVTRGQVVEKLCADSDWIYVRNVDGRCGYIPHSFCYGMDQVISGQHWSDDGGQGLRPNSPPSRQHLPKSNRVNTVVNRSGSLSSVEVHSTEAPLTSPQQPSSSLFHSQHPVSSSTSIRRPTAERLETPDSTPPLTRSNRRLSSLQPSAEHITMEAADSAIVEEPRYVEHPHCNTAAAAVTSVAVPSSNQNRPPPPRVPVRRSLSMNDSARLSCRSHPPNMRTVDPIQRSISYQEAVLSAGQDPYCLVNGRNSAPTQPIVSPLNQRQQPEGHMMPLSPLNPKHQRGHMTQTVDHCDWNCDVRCPDFDPSDDVFLPEPKKPVGIYRCLQTYNPKYQGELSVKEGEMVILLEFGRGDWAWVLTSMNQEGLLPRQYLVRYNPRLGVGGPRQAARRETNSSSNASTQTELIVDGGCVRHVSGASSASAGATAYSGSSSSSVATPQTTPTLTQRAKRHHKSTRAKEVAKGGEQYVAIPADQAVEPLTSTPWFENVDSLERRPRPANLNCSVQTTPPPRPTNLNCSAQTTPPMKHRRVLANTATPQSVKSADCYLDNRTPNPAALLTPNPIKSADYAGTANAQFWFNSLSSTSSSVHVINPAPVLTAIRDYNPPPSAKNCLHLSEGDELRAQPHMHYPKGWMWVWHKTQRSFGYVPQSHVGYTYTVSKGERSRSNTVEDAV